MLIGELSKESNVSIRSIRHYEGKGLLESQRSGNGYRHYQPDAIGRVKVIKTCLGLGFSLKEVALILGCTNQDVEPLPRCERAAEMYRQRLRALEEQLTNLNLVRELLQKAIGEQEI